jgi:enoyl-CoA hydratase/carnithine racemase
VPRSGAKNTRVKIILAEQLIPPPLFSRMALPLPRPYRRFAKHNRLTGERLTAARAVHRAVPVAELDRAVEEVAGLVRLGSPNAVREAKQLVRCVPTLSLDEAFRATTATSLALFASEEAAEGMQAFLQKRKPRWAE